MTEHQSNDGRSAGAKAYHWASKIMTVSLEMVVPGVVGYFLLDRYLGTKFVFCLLGFAGGMTLGIWHLMQLTSDDSKSSS